MKAEQPRVAVGVFGDREQARDAVAALRERGFGASQVSLLMPHPEASVAPTTSTETSVGEGAVAGAVAGGLLGGLWGWLAGISALVVPGVGPLLAVGAFATALTGAALGAGLGAVAGALIGLGVPREEAEWYESELRSGRTLVAVQANERYPEARDLLRQHGAYDVEMRAVGAVTAPARASRPGRDTDAPATESAMGGAAAGSTAVPAPASEPAARPAAVPDEGRDVRQQGGGPNAADAPIGAGIAFGHEDEARPGPVPSRSVEYPVTRGTEKPTYLAGAPEPPPSALPGRWEDVLPEYRARWEQAPAGERGRWEEQEAVYRVCWERATATPADRDRSWADAEPALRRDWETRYPERPWERVAAAMRDAWAAVTRSPVRR